MADVKGDWSSRDNKRYRGKLDRIYVSTTETYEVEYYIDSYLESRGAKKISDRNRDAVADALEQYQGSAPLKRIDLDKFLDARFNRKPVV